ncbi:hypothetical protein Dimus_001412 [Dionaea muscipula]
MSDNGLENVMELIKRQRWENLFKKRLLVHVDAVKEFYAKMRVIHLKKKDVVKSSVKGISIEFDHEQSVAILDVPGRTGICEYIKEVWEESRIGEKFYDARGRSSRLSESLDEIPSEATPSSAQQKDKGIAGVDPSGPTGREAEFLKFQAEFERKRANRFHDELEKAKAENAKLLALLHQAQTKPHP